MEPVLLTYLHYGRTGCCRLYPEEKYKIIKKHEENLKTIMYSHNSKASKENENEVL